ncbi:hypothetical protein FHH43_04260 [Clostridium perfringens]|nr:hypothetical protein [Clostridium perfringens]
MEQNMSKKSSVGQFLKSVFNIFIKNLVDIAMISVIFAIPALIGRGNTIFSVISIFSLGFSSIAIIKLVNNFINGKKISWIETIKSSFKNSIFPLGVFMIQNFAISLGSSIFAPAGIILSIFFIIAMQCSIFENISVIESIKKSFSLVKNNFLDILLKQFSLVILINLATTMFAMFLNQSQASIIIFSLVLNIATALSLISGNLIYKELAI